MAETMGEKVVRLETQMNEVGKKVDRIEVKVDQLLDRFDSTASSFITKAEFEAFKKSRWLENTLSAGAGAILLGLIYYFITHGSFGG